MHLPVPCTARDTHADKDMEAATADLCGTSHPTLRCATRTIRTHSFTLSIPPTRRERMATTSPAPPSIVRTPQGTPDEIKPQTTHTITNISVEEVGKHDARRAASYNHKLPSNKYRPGARKKLTPGTRTASATKRVDDAYLQRDTNLTFGASLDITRPQEDA